MILTLYSNFSKRKNSTKIPTGGTTAEVVLKSGTSLESPVFLIDGIDLNVNYCQWEGHYYFINDIVLGNNNIYELHCTQDLLATYKSTILSSSQYVVRSASKYNGYVLDNMYPGTGKMTSSYKDEYLSSGSKLFPFSISGGYYVVGIINKAGSSEGAIGATTYICFDNEQMRDFMNALLNDTTYVGTVSIGDTLLKALFNPFQYVASCIWIPFQPSHMEEIDTVSLGWFDINVSASLITSISDIPSKSTYIDLAQHPQVERGKYLNGAPFTSRVLDAGPFGIVELDSTSLIDATQLNIEVKNIDYVSGMATMYISAKDSGVGSGTTMLRGQVGVPIQLGQVSTNYLNSIASTVSGAGAIVGAAVSENWTGVVGAASGMIMNVFNSLIPNVQTSGSNGNFSQLGITMNISSKFHYIADEDLEHLGRPLCEKVVLSTLSGYTKCGGASLSIPGLESDKDEINNYLNNGFYIE